MISQQQTDLEVDVVILAIEVALRCFVVGDLKADWSAIEPMTADDLIASLTSLMGGCS